MQGDKGFPDSKAAEEYQSRGSVTVSRVIGPLPAIINLAETLSASSNEALVWHGVPEALSEAIRARTAVAVQKARRQEPIAFCLLSKHVPAACRSLSTRTQLQNQLTFRDAPSLADLMENVRFHKNPAEYQSQFSMETLNAARKFSRCKACS